mgnify:CR=1 FL=1
MMKRAQTWLAALAWEKKILLYAGVLSLIPLVGLSLQPARPAPKKEIAEVDTLIPQGFVLIPIEVQNYEALDSILGRFGLVDLFQAGEGQGRLVARNVRILRAPQNPTHFAVLVAENRVDEILKNGGLFTVIVKRPGGAGTEFVTTAQPKRRKIVYEGE